MNILYKTEAFAARNTFIGFISAIICLICVITLIDTLGKFEWYFTVIVMIITALSCVGMAYGFVRVPSGRYQYQVTIDGDYAASELYDSYDVIERKGDIWIIEDKK